MALTLASLRDVEGIVGSFVVSADGELLAQDLPAYFVGAAEEVGARIVRLRDALTLSEGAVSTCMVRYRSHKLALKSVQGAVLAVISSHTVNAPALRMAMNLVARRCASEVKALAALPRSASRSALLSPGQRSTTGAVQSAETATAESSGTLRALSVPLGKPRSRPPPAAAPESAAATPHRKQRPLYFRGKRLD